MKVRQSKGYLVSDIKKCTGCCSCMLACSLVHEGRSDLSLSRIQILDDPFGSYPADIVMAICQQCQDPQCYFACPLKGQAFCIDEKTGTRYIHEDECIGCKQCIEACHFNPSRISFDPVRKIAVKCDLCQRTPYRNSQRKKACVEVCPAKAIKFTKVKPVGYRGYVVNLRGVGWAKLGLPTD